MTAADTDKPRRNRPRDRAPGTGRDDEHMRLMLQARIRAVRERKIAGLIESAPPLTAEQKARLAVLLNSHPEA